MARGAGRHGLLAEEPSWSYPAGLWHRKPHIHREGRVDVAIKTPAVTALLRLLSEPEALAGSSETQKAFLDGLGAREVPLPSTYQILSTRSRWGLILRLLLHLLLSWSQSCRSLNPCACAAGDGAAALLSLLEAAYARHFLDVADEVSAWESSALLSFSQLVRFRLPDSFRRCALPG